MMGWLGHLRCRRLVVRHFARDLSSGGEKRMRRHLSRCPECRGLYMALCLAEGDGPRAALVRRQRLERALFGPGEPRPARGRLVLGAAATVAAVVLAVVVLPRFLGEPPFREKGLSAAPDRYVSVAVYRARRAAQECARTGGTVQGKRAPRPPSSARYNCERARVGGVVGRREPLAFAYSNLSRERFDRLLLFGVDEHYTVYWYYPAWTDPAKKPRAVPVRRGSGIELTEEVTHDYAGSLLRLFAVFSRRRDLSVETVEQIVRRLKRRGVPVRSMVRFPLEGTGQHTTLLEVRAR